MIADAGGRLDGIGIAIVHLLHQAAAGPVGGGVVAGLIGIVAVFSVAGDGGVDEAGI